MRITAIALLLGTLGLSACDGSSDIILLPITSRFGTFVLQTVNGQALPVVVVDSVSPAVRIAVVSGSITINTNNTFVDVAAFQETRGGVVTSRSVTCTGTFTVVTNSFTFVETAVAPNCGRTFTGVLTGNSLSASILGVPAVFTR